MDDNHSNVRKGGAHQPFIKKIDPGQQGGGDPPLASLLRYEQGHPTLLRRRAYASRLLFLIDIGPALPGGQSSTRGFFPFLACVPNLLGCRSAQEKKALRRIYQLKKYKNIFLYQGPTFHQAQPNKMQGLGAQGTKVPGYVSSGVSSFSTLKGWSPRSQERAELGACSFGSVVFFIPPVGKGGIKNSQG